MTCYEKMTNTDVLSLTPNDTAVIEMDDMLDELLDSVIDLQEKAQRYREFDPEYSIDVLDRGTREQLRMQMISYRGKPGFSIRVWVKTAQGQWIPTKRGINITPDEVFDLIYAAAHALNQCYPLNPSRPREE
ncbi:MAG: transcriptional coactivator p15/PC4 family protein [bacterium]